MGGALEPEGAETVEENGGKVHYLLEEDIEVEDMVDGSSNDFGHGDNIEANGHALSSNFSQKLHLDQNLEQHVQQVSLQNHSGQNVLRNNFSKYSFLFTNLLLQSCFSLPIKPIILPMSG